MTYLEQALFYLVKYITNGNIRENDVQHWIDELRATADQLEDYYDNNSSSSTEE